MSYTPETTRSDNDPITAALWNQAVRANIIALADGSGYPALGRLTLETGVPVSTSNQSAKATVYYTPVATNGTGPGNGQIWLYNPSDTAWEPYPFDEISASASALGVYTPADAFVYDDEGLALEFVNWTNATTRATSLATQNGIYVQTGAPQKRFVGTICGDQDGAKTADSLTQRLVWNYYNRAARALRGTDTADRTRTATAYNEMNDAYTTRFVLGVNEEPIFIAASVDAHGTLYGTVSVGLDGDTPPTGVNHLYIPENMREQGTVSGVIYPGVGYHYMQLVGRISNSAGTLTVYYRADSTASPTTINAAYIYG